MLAGCFGDDDSDQKKLIDLVVHYDATNGTIQQSFIGGSQISFTGVTFSFDFARTTSDYGLKTSRSTQVMALNHQYRCI